MIEIVLLILFLIIGYFTGLFSAMVGIGGGLLFVPILYLTLPYAGIENSQITYIVLATSLFAASINTLSAFLNHFWVKNIILRKVIFFAIGTAISSVFSSLYTPSIDPLYLKIIFAVVFLLISLKMFFENRRKTEIREKTLLTNDFYLILFGLLIGPVPAFVGIGGGILFVPVLIYFYHIDIKKAIGTSAGIVFITTALTSFSYMFQKPSIEPVNFQIGYVYLLAGIPLGLGAIFGAANGVRIMVKSSSVFIKKIFAFLLLIAVLKIILEL